MEKQLYLNQTYELEQIVLDIIISTGLVSNLTSDAEKYYYNSSLAHCVYYGSTVIPGCSGHLHGEIVSFGVLCLLTYDKQFEKRDRIYEFNKSIGLPTCLDDIGIKKEDVQKMVSRMNGVTEWYCTPYEVTEEEFVKAILDTDEYSKSR